MGTDICKRKEKKKNGKKMKKKTTKSKSQEKVLRTKRYLEKLFRNK